MVFTLVQTGNPFCSMYLVALLTADSFSPVVLSRPIHTKNPAAPVSRMKQSCEPDWCHRR